MRVLEEHWNTTMWGMFADQSYVGKGDRFTILLADKTLVELELTKGGATIRTAKQDPKTREFPRSEVLHTLKGPEVNVGYLNTGDAEFKEVSPGRWKLSIGDVDIYGHEEGFGKLADLINRHTKNGGIENATKTTSVS